MYVNLRSTQRPLPWSFFVKLIANGSEYLHVLLTKLPKYLFSRSAYIVTPNTGGNDFLVLIKYSKTPSPTKCATKWTFTFNENEIKFLSLLLKTASICRESSTSSGSRESDSDYTSGSRESDSDYTRIKGVVRKTLDEDSELKEEIEKLQDNEKEEIVSTIVDAIWSAKYGKKDGKKDGKYDEEESIEEESPQESLSEEDYTKEMAKIILRILQKTLNLMVVLVCANQENRKGENDRKGKDSGYVLLCPKDLEKFCNNLSKRSLSITVISPPGKHHFNVRVGSNRDPLRVPKNRILSWTSSPCVE